MEHISSWSMLIMLNHKNTESLLQASREVGPEVNTEKTKYMVVFCHQLTNC